MKERLIELLKETDEMCKKNERCQGCSGYDKGSACQHHLRADAILADGWIRPPCKVGQTVYRIVEMSTGVTKVIKRTLCPPYKSDVLINCKPTIKIFVRSVVVTKNNFFDVVENWGISVFATKEEAEQSLVNYKSCKNDGERKED